MMEGPASEMCWAPGVERSGSVGEATVVALGSGNPSEVGKREYRYLPEIEMEAGTGLRVSLCWFWLGWLYNLYVQSLCAGRGLVGEGGGR